MAALENVPGRESSGRWLSRAALFGAGMLEAWAAPKVIGALTRWSGPKDLFDAGVEAIDRRRRWRGHASISARFPPFDLAHRQVRLRFRKGCDWRSRFLDLRRHWSRSSRLGCTCA